MTTKPAAHLSKSVLPESSNVPLKPQTPVLSNTATISDNSQLPDEHILKQKENLENYANILVQKLQAKNAEVDFLKKQLGAIEKAQYSSAISKNQTNGQPNTTLISYIKKTRHLNVQLEKERSARSKYCTKVNELQHQLQQVQGSQNASEISAIQEKSQRLKQAWHSKLSQVTEQLDQERAHANSLRTQVGLLTRALVSEIGGDPSTEKINQLINESKGWKGRAQQMIILKSKVKELQAQLDRQSTPQNGKSPPLEHTDKLRRERQRILDAEKDAELVQLREKTHELQGTIDSLRARCQTLSQTGKNTKSMLRSVIEKASKDDKLIHALHQEIEHLKNVILSSSPQPAGNLLPSLVPGKENVASILNDNDNEDKDLFSKRDSEINHLRTLRKEQAAHIKEQTERIGQLEIALQHERHKLSKWCPPDSELTGSKMPPSERKALVAENAALCSKISVLKDEVKVLQTSLDATVIAKERELAMYCQALDDQNRESKATKVQHSLYSSPVSNNHSLLFNKDQTSFSSSPVPHAMYV